MCFTPLCTSKQMMSLFSSFDMCFQPMMYLTFLLFILNFLSKLYHISLLNLFLHSGQYSASDFFQSLRPYDSKGVSNLLISLFTLLFYFNFSSVMSYTFPLNSQLSQVLYLGSVLWLSFVIFSLVRHMKGFLSHCIPEGTPFALVPLMFVIELVSQVIRPVTLSVRMTANILAGHLLMSLLSSLALYSLPGSFVYVGLNLVEFFVSLIQSFIFATMLKLYYAEV